MTGVINSCERVVVLRRTFGCGPEKGRWGSEQAGYCLLLGSLSLGLGSLGLGSFRLGGLGLGSLLGGLGLLGSWLLGSLLGRRLGLLGSWLLGSLLGGLGLLGSLLGRLGLFGSWLLGGGLLGDLLGLLNLAQLEGSGGTSSLGLDELASSNSRLQVPLDEGSQLGDIDILVVGSDVLLDGSQGGSLPVLEGTDGVVDHGGHWRVGRCHLGLLGLNDLLDYCLGWGGCGGVRHVADCCRCVVNTSVDDAGTEGSQCMPTFAASRL